MIEQNFPTLYQVLGSTWAQRNLRELEEYVQRMVPWLVQLESDLLSLMKYVGLEELVRCYRSACRDMNQIQETVYEIHGCHLMASVGGNIRLHVPLDDGRRGNFDFQVNILGNIISGDVKTRKERFPFSLPSKRDESGVEIFGGTRATLDPHKAVHLNIPAQSNVDIDKPESTVIEQLLEKSITQLPTFGKTIVIVGQLRGNSDAKIDLEEALFGTEGLGYKKNTGKFESFRYPTGIFLGLPEYEQFKRLSAVLSIKVTRLLDHKMAKIYRLYRNPAANDPVPDAVAEAIEMTTNDWKGLSGKTN